MNALSLCAWTAALFLASTVFAHNVALRLILLALATAMAVLALARGSLKALPAIWVPFVAWAAWAALSLSWSLELGRSEKEFCNEVIYTGLALFVCHIGAQAKEAQRVFLAVMATAAVLACAAALYAFASGAVFESSGWHG